jgi:lysophospholipase II
LSDLRKVLGGIGGDVTPVEYVGAEREGHWVKAPEQVDHVVAFIQGLIE